MSALEQVKHFIVFALVDRETIGGKNDVDMQSIPPLWPPPAQGVVVEDGVYEAALVPVTSIALVTSRIIKVTSVANPM